MLARPELPKPNFKTDTPVCPTGQLQCADGQCLEQESILLKSDFGRKLF
jgi:hypothetical protein